MCLIDFGALFFPLLFKEMKAVEELVCVVASLTRHHSYPWGCTPAVPQTIFLLTQAVFSLTRTLWKILVCEVEDVHTLKSSPSPTSSGCSWTKAGTEKGHDLVKSTRAHSFAELIHEASHIWETENNWHIISAPMHSKQFTAFLLPESGVSALTLPSPWHLSISEHFELLCLSLQPTLSDAFCHWCLSATVNFT